MDDAVRDIENVGGGIRNVPDGIYGLEIGKKIIGKLWKFEIENWNWNRRL